MTGEEPNLFPQEPESSSEEIESESGETEFVSEEDESEEDESDGEDFEYTPLTREDFGPGEEWFRDLFFAFREEDDEALAAWEKEEAMKKEAEARRQNGSAGGEGSA